MNNFQKQINKIFTAITVASLVLLSTPIATLAASNVQEIKITNITDGSSYNANTIPSYIEGIAADSQGLNQDSVKYYLQRNDTKKYWNGSSWIDSYQLDALNAEVTGDGSVKWISNSNFPSSWDEGKYFVTAKETNKIGEFKESQTVTFNYDNTTPSNISLSINDGATSTLNKYVTLKLTYDADVYEMRVSNNIQFTREPWGLADTKIENWQLTDESGTKTIYAQFRDRAGNTSEIISASINYQYVISPSNLNTTAKDGAVKLTWDRVSGVDHYDVQYRKTSDNNYTYVPVIKSNDTEIINLTNDTAYEFQVRAVDQYGNMSTYASTACTPKKTPAVNYSATTVSNNQTSTTYFDSSIYTNNASSTNINTDQNTSSDQSEEVIEEDKEATIDNNVAKTEEKTEGQTDSARTAVTIGVIIIAIGAALGGYYGYQWWISADEEETEEKTDTKKEKEEPKKEEPKKPIKENKPKKNKQNRRW